MGSLVARLEAHTGLVVVAVTATGRAAKTRALAIARTATKRSNLVACRGTEVDPGTRLVSHGDTLQAVRAFQQDQPAAFVLEVVQASNSACVPPPKYLIRIREGCTQHGVLLVSDETTIGLGRTGSLLAIEREKVKPDLVALSLAVAPGVDGGLVLANRELLIESELTLSPAAAAALEVLEIIERDGLLTRAKEVGRQLQFKIHEILESRRRWAMDTRGRGLLHSLSLWDDPSIVIANAAARGIAIARTGENGLLFAPPLTTTKADLDETFTVLDEVLSDR